MLKTVQKSIFFFKGIGVTIFNLSGLNVFTVSNGCYYHTFAYRNHRTIKINYHPPSRCMMFVSLFKSFRPAYFEKVFNKGLNYYFKFYYMSLRYIGKGYKFYKKKMQHTYTFYLGFSHLYYVYNIYNRSFIKIKRFIFLYGSDYRRLRNTAFSIRNTRYANIFTERGVRFRKQTLYKKTGKISSY